MYTSRIKYMCLMTTTIIKATRKPKRLTTQLPTLGPAGHLEAVFDRVLIAQSRQSRPSGSALQENSSLSAHQTHTTWFLM